MSKCKLAIIYFSATNVTHSYSEVMGNKLQDQDCDVQLFNMTAYATRQEPIPIDVFDCFIFGFPVFSDFAPCVINDWLPTLKGKRKRCAMFFTYGARTTGYAHFHTKLLLEQAGFRVILSAEFLGRHSFNVGGWRILPDRPNEQDFTVACNFVDCALERFLREDLADFNLQKPFGYNQAIASLKKEPKNTERAWTHPVRITDECSMCRDCETECPTQAFDANLGESDPEKCIECMHCVFICPDQVLKIDSRMEKAYSDFLSYWHLTEEMMAAKKSKIITESWQTAF